MKKLLCAFAALAVSATVLLSGCSLFGGEENVFDVTVNNNYTSMTDEQWEEYKNMLAQSGANENTALQTSVNGSLLSGVSILTRFTYNDLTCYVDDYFGNTKQVGKLTYHAVYCGAGVITELDKSSGNAYVVTNCHVIYDDSSKEVIANEVSLYLYGQDSRGVNYDLDVKRVQSGGKDVFYKEDGEEYYLNDYTIVNDKNFKISAEVVASSATYDIALLKITNSGVLKNSNAMAAEFTDKDEVYVGTRAYAVGNPEGDGMSATFGFVTKDREEISLNLSEVDENAYLNYTVMRTDAAINGGNSGGGFYGADGKLIGIVNAKTTGDDIDNMGYVLPASNVRRLVKLMKEVEGAYYLSGNTPNVKVAQFPAEYKVIAATSYINPETMLAEISETVAVSSSAGVFKAGDVLKNIKITDKSGTVIENITITRAYHIEDILLSARDGYTVTFTVERGGVETEVSYSAALAKI